MNQQKGFTLIEIGLVLVIIGLLISGLVKAHSVIESTKVKDLRRDFNEFSAAVHTYQDKYGVLPGDDARAALHVGARESTDEGNGNGVLEGSYVSDNDEEESRKLWLHLRLSGLVAGSGTEQPISAFGTKMGVENNNNGLNGMVVCVQSLPAEAAQIFDQRYDDGVFDRGSIRASADYTEARTVCQKL